eukprot:scaffold11282_cov18-Tisochrysis_lutea.AAC.1
MSDSYAHVRHLHCISKLKRASSFTYHTATDSGSLPLASIDACGYEQINQASLLQMSTVAWRSATVNRPSGVYTLDLNIACKRPPGVYILDLTQKKVIKESPSNQCGEDFDPSDPLPFYDLGNSYKKCSCCKHEGIHINSSLMKKSAWVSQSGLKMTWACGRGMAPYQP